MPKNRILKFPVPIGGEQDVQAPMRALVYSIAASQTPAPAVVTFISARRGEGASTMAYDYAKATAVQTSRKTLLIEAGPFYYTAHHGLADTFLNDLPQEHIFEPVTDKLFHIRWLKNEHQHKAATELAKNALFWKSLKDTFDSIVIDAPALQYSSEGIFLAAAADTAVIVTQAETTPEHAVTHLRDSLDKAGAKIAGIVLNKRRYHIPQKLYQ